MLNKYHFAGKLTLSQSIDTMEYGVVTKTDHDILFNNITDILNEIYLSSSPFISVRISQNNGSHCINKSGQLNNRPDRYGVFGLHIDDFPLELELDERTGQDIDITIKHLEEKEFKKKVLEATS
jgi:hypothetical protein